MWLFFTTRTPRAFKYGRTENAETRQYMREVPAGNSKCGDFQNDFHRADLENERNKVWFGY